MPEDSSQCNKETLESASAMCDELVKSNFAHRKAMSNAGIVVYEHDNANDCFRYIDVDSLESMFGVRYKGSHGDFWRRTRIVDYRCLGELTGCSFEQAVDAYKSGKKKSWRTEFRIQKPNGEYRWISDNATPVIIEGQDEIHGSFGVLQDITEQKRQAEILGGILKTASLSGQEFLESLVLELSKCIGSKYAFIARVDPAFPGQIFISALAVDGKIAPNFQYAQKGTPCENVLENGTCYIRKALQESFPDDILLVEMNAQAYLGEPLFSVEHIPIGLIVAVHDGPIDESFDPQTIIQLFGSRASSELERQRKERLVEQSERFYRTLVSVQSEGIIVQDEADHILACNQSACRISRASEDQLLGKSSFDPQFKIVNVDGKPWDPTLAPSILAIRTGEPQRDRILGMKFGEDDITWISVNAMPIENASVPGERHVVVSFADITARLEAEADLLAVNANLETAVDERTKDLRTANDDLESFAYSISHDLRQPLRAIDGFSRMLEMDYGDIVTGSGRDYIARIRAATKRMADLIDDLLRISRVSSHALHVDDVNLSELAREVVGQLTADGAYQNVDFQIENKIFARADANLIRAVLHNLIENAVKFTTSNDAALVEFGQQTGTYYVRDNGVGFDMQYSSKLFQPFQRLHSEKEFEGSGIGLATVKRIIERHRGEIWAESELGKGTTIYFKLPQ